VRESIRTSENNRERTVTNEIDLKIGCDDAITVEHLFSVSLVSSQANQGGLR
jgi:hypothetical protein